MGGWFRGGVQIFELLRGFGTSGGTNSDEGITIHHADFPIDMSMDKNFGLHKPIYTSFSLEDRIKQRLMKEIMC